MADEQPEKDAEEAAVEAAADAEPGADPHEQLDEAKAEAGEQPAKPKRARARKPKASAADEPASAEGKPADAKKDAAVAEAKGDTGAAEKPKRARRAKRASAADADAGEAKETAKPAAESKPPRAKRATAAPSASSPARTRSRSASKGDGHGDAGRRPVVRAQAKYVRTSARKARMVCGHLRGKSIAEARAILAFTPRQVARDWSKLLDSAVANAENNHELVEEDLIVREAYADEGPTIKRFRPRARGRASSIRKRTSHLTITLTPDR
jgi:ribosomal protein L22